MTKLEKQNIRAAAEAVIQADALLVTAGAGMGVDSGLPDFRGTEGFWKAYPAVAEKGLSFAQMANPEWFRNDPHFAWAFYGHRLILYRRTIPHAGFAWLLARGKEKANGYFVFTSNVDGQFQKAGFDPERMVECHGSIHHFQCAAVCTKSIREATAENIVVDESIFRAQSPLPKCDRCGGIARPNIMMFGDFDWISARSQAQNERFTQWIQLLERKSARLVVIELGAGTAIPTVRYTSEIMAERPGGRLIRINPREPETPVNQISLPTDALAGLRQIAEAMTK